MPFTFPRPRTALLCGLLLCATLINYMDRQALSSLATRISGELGLTNQDYGSLERAFGLAFATGSLAFGFLADAVSVRWLYPAVLVAWSAMGIVTGFAKTYDDLFYCRMFLGFFEAGHWPCAMQTIRRSLKDEDRGLGNSVLQSGASIGAIVTPIIIQLMIPLGSDGEPSQEPGLWRLPFIVFGGIGFAWATGWMATVRRRDLQQAAEVEETQQIGLLADLLRLLKTGKFWTLLLVVIAINTSWQIFRGWLPKLLQEGRGYKENVALSFTSGYYIATDAGCIAAGLATKWLATRGVSVFNSRRITYTVSSLCCASIVLLPWTPSGTPLLMLWLLAGAGALGVFPCYYSFVQSLSERHPAKIFGILSFCAWLTTSPLQKIFGTWIDSMIAANVSLPFDRMMVAVGILPLIAAIPLWLLWREKPQPTEKTS
ncbi:L-galactonate transporter [Caulifigura coniformis]|uniref:L-galactonate transporter n=1 Tax=Caulifigura coniformis TaxID=2527983 RepID=A0A517SFQ9_9PLAN|nr:MFS transporter [Caulifigura coniformis]QDT54965.1 L-galactonate transporter [Caulifigura coniformis]